MARRLLHPVHHQATVDGVLHAAKDYWDGPGLPPTRASDEKLAVPVHRRLMTAGSCH